MIGAGGAGSFEVWHPRRHLALALPCVAQFVAVLGVTIVVVALPSVARDLGFSGAGLQWVVSVYALFFGGFLMLAGRAADLFGRRRLFLGGLALGISTEGGLAHLIAGLALSGCGLGCASVASTARRGVPAGVLCRRRACGGRGARRAATG